MTKLTRPWHTWPAHIKAEFREFERDAVENKITIRRQRIRLCAPNSYGGVYVEFDGVNEDPAHLVISYDEFKAWWLGCDDGDCE